MQSLSNRDEIGNNFYDDNKTLCVDVNGVLLIAMGLPGSNQNVFLRTEHLRETRMVYPNPRCWESKTLQLTQPRALEPVLKMQTSFAPFLCCQDSTDQLSMKAFGRLSAGHQCQDFIPRVLPERWWEDEHWCWKFRWRPVAILQHWPEMSLSALLFPGRMTQQQQTFIKSGSRLFPGPGTITPRQF